MNEHIQSLTAINCLAVDEGLLDMTYTDDSFDANLETLKATLSDTYDSNKVKINCEANTMFMKLLVEDRDDIVYAKDFIESLISALKLMLTAALVDSYNQYLQEKQEKCFVFRVLTTPFYRFVNDTLYNQYLMRNDRLAIAVYNLKALNKDLKSVIKLTQNTDYDINAEKQLIAFKLPTTVALDLFSYDV